MLGVAQRTVMAEALPVEIEKREHGTAKGHNRKARWRLQRGNDTQEVGKQNINRNRTGEGDELDRVRAGVLFQQVLNTKAHGIGNEQLGNLLSSARAVNGKVRANYHGKSDSHKQSEHGHDEVFGDGALVIGGLDVQRVIQHQRVRSKDVVDPLCETAYVFFHSSVPGMQ